MGNAYCKRKDTTEVVNKPQPPNQDPTMVLPLTNISDENFVNYLNNLWDGDKDNVRILNELPIRKCIDQEAFEKFKDSVNLNFSDLTILGNFSYTNELEKEVRLKKNELSLEDLKLAYLAILDLNEYNEINNTVMNNINKVYIAPKIKDINKDNLNTKNYRFIQIHSKVIKLLDRLWCLKIMNIVKSLDKTIFKSNLVRDMNASVVETASANTLSIENVVLIDIEKAFDSCDYEVVETLLSKSLKRRVNDTSVSLTKQYMYLIKQRVLYYKDKTINFKKGIPTGLPSSNIIFSLIMDEIINEWLSENNDIFKIEKDFKINIFVDDIYLKIYNKSITDIIITTLINKFTKYKFKVNIEKCKADEKLQIENFSKLEESDYYLGIPFTRDLKKYSQVILKDYNKVNKNTDTYNDIYLKIKDKNIEHKQIYGFFNYKLKPMLNNTDLLLYFEKYLI